MNHWLAEELTWLACAERKRELDALLLCAEVGELQAKWTLFARAALKLSNWLIATGESIQQRYEKTASVSL